MQYVVVTFSEQGLNFEAVLVIQLKNSEDPIVGSVVSLFRILEGAIGFFDKVSRFISTVISSCRGFDAQAKTHPSSRVIRREGDKADPVLKNC